MALNFPGPYQLRLFYQVNGTPGGVVDHVMALNLDCSPAPSPGDAFSAITVVTSLGTKALDGVVNALVAVLQPEFNSSATSFLSAELWKYTTGTFQASYISSMSVGLAGTSTSTNKEATQSIYTFRTTEGGIMKVTLMEDVYEKDEPIPYTGLTTESKAIVDFFVTGGVDGVFFLARDTSFPIAFLKKFPGENEATFKSRFGRN